MGCGCGPWRTCTGKIYNENWEYCVRCGHKQPKGMRDEDELNLDDYEEALEDGRRLAKELSDFIHQAGDGPERPSLCDVVAVVKSEVTKIRNIIECLAYLTDHDGLSGFQITIKYDNSGDGGVVINSDGKVIGQCYDIDKSPNEQVIQAMRMAAKSFWEEYCQP